MNKSEQIARLRLIRTRNTGPMTYSLLMRRYGSAEAAIAAIPTLAQRGGSKISLASIASVKDELESIDAAGAVLLLRDSEYYPERLAQFDDAPACITARGNLHLLTQPMIVIVGAKNALINAQTFFHPQPGDCQPRTWCCGCRSGAPVRLADHRQRSRNPGQRCDGGSGITA